MQIRGDSISTIAKWGGGILIVFVLANWAQTLVPLLKLVFLGWATYVMRVVPAAHVNWTAAIYTAICLAILIAGSHLFLRWLYRSVTKSSWRLKWTLSGAAVISLLFFSGMSVMGMAHQTAWLITSPYRLTERRADWNCRSNMREIGMAILMYQQDHGQNYPPDLSTLMATEELSPWRLVCPSSDDQPASDATTQVSVDALRLPGHCSYIYLGRGLKQPVADSRVILIEPPGNHAGDGMNVLFGDGHAEWVVRNRAAQI